MDGDATPSSLHASDECGERSDEAEAEAEASRVQCAQLSTPANSSRARYSVCDREGVEGGVEDMIMSPEEMQLVPSASSSTATPPTTVMAMARIDTKEVAVESSDSDSSVEVTFEDSEEDGEDGDTIVEAADDAQSANLTNAHAGEGASAVSPTS
eukprot:m.347705 g.347705  ORF g.347705 m.347705 type:complete len:155 (+) comp27927_c0_seq1:188-652(+)